MIVTVDELVELGSRGAAGNFTCKEIVEQCLVDIACFPSAQYWNRYDSGYSMSKIGNQLPI